MRGIESYKGSLEGDKMFYKILKTTELLTLKWLKIMIFMLI